MGGTGSNPPVKVTRNFAKHAEGSRLIEMGDTKVICTASIEEKFHRFSKGKGPAG